MDGVPQSPLALINRGVLAHRAGNESDARALFARAVLADPSNELGWLWFAEASAIPGERRYCLDRAVRINPDSAGRAQRELLLSTAPILPQSLIDVETPQLPPGFAPAPKSPRRTITLPILPGKIRVAPKSPDKSASPAWLSRFSPGGSGFRWLVGVAVLAGAAVIALLVWQNRQHNDNYIAIVGPMSGPNSAVGTEMVRSAQLSLDAANNANSGRDLALLVYDDQNNPELARQRAGEIVSDGRALLVIGHGTSDTSLAGAEIYRAAGIPAISGQATIDELTKDNPWYFRTIFTNSTQGDLLATYIQNVLGLTTASVITGPGAYEQSLGRAFTSAFGSEGTVKHTWQLGVDQHDVTIQTILTELSSDSEPGIIVLALTATDARELIVAIRRQGLAPKLIGGDSIGSANFGESFQQYPEEQATPGFFTDGLYAVAPIIFDSFGGDALAFSNRFLEKFGRAPSWRGAKVYDAATISAAAVRAAGITGSKANRTSDRLAIRDAIAALNTPGVALRGLTGLLYFDANGDIPQAFSLGIFAGGHLTSAPVQYRVVTNPENYDIDAEVAAGHAVIVNGFAMRQYRIAYAGIDLIEMRDLNTSAQTYLADFFLYVRFQGDDITRDIFFTNATDASLSLGEPLESSTDENGLTSMLFRVQGTFSEPLTFVDYPFDRHRLAIRFQNIALDDGDLVFVPDAAVLNQPQSQRLLSGFDLSRQFNRIPDWNTTRVDYSQIPVTASSGAYSGEGGATELKQYSEFRVSTLIERDVQRFLIKNLLPLTLLALVTYVSLFFPAEQAGTRISFAITSVLTTSVLLGSISGNLPQIGYTVAIEWGYYVFIALSAVLVLLNIMIDRLYKQKRLSEVRRLDLFERIFYPAVVATTVVVYLYKFA